VKGKKVDIYLARAELFQLLLIGAGGALFAELIQDNVRLIVVCPTLLISLLSTRLIYFSYSKAHSIARKSKKRRYDDP